LCNVTASYVPNWRNGAKTLGQWLKASAVWRKRKPYLVVAGNHFQLVQGRSYVCGISRDVVSQKHPVVKRKARITEVYELRVKPGCHIEIPADARKPKLTRKVDENYRAFRQYCKEQGLSYEIAHDDYIEFSDGIQFPWYGCWSEALERHHSVTDEASAIEASGLSPALVAGNLRNFKVTTMDDLQAMRASLAMTRESAGLSSAVSPAASPTTEAGAAGARFRIGQGWDVHALVPGRALLIGGVTVPFDRGLLGHSDADVLLHAITDALLGAAALGDIGRHFPDTDARFAGADSRVLLREAVARVRAAGWVPGNVDCTVVAQAPKLSSHIPAMVAAISADLGVAPSQVNVKAKTAEKLGFAGRGEGIEAHATVLLVAAA
jgi:2-C-methyl-D-erythritol 2,4-cyclodiphosphate synthase